MTSRQRIVVERNPLTGQFFVSGNRRVLERLIGEYHLQPHHFADWVRDTILHHEGYDPEMDAQEMQGLERELERANDEIVNLEDEKDRLEEEVSELHDRLHKERNVRFCPL